MTKNIKFPNKPISNEDVKNGKSFRIQVGFTKDELLLLKRFCAENRVSVSQTARHATLSFIKK
jgi:hypothetical protein